MRKFLLVLVVLEAVALAAAGGFLALGGADRHKQRVGAAPVFTPPFYNAAIGDTVRYRIEDREGNVTGYFEYYVRGATVYEGTTVGRDFAVRMTDLDARGKPRRAPRLIRIRPRAAGHGWLPPAFDEGDDYPAGARPVMKTLESLDGGRFRVDAVTPRDSLTEISDRFWIDPEIPVFGVRRWERGDRVWVYHTGDFGARAR